MKCGIVFLLWAPHSDVTLDDIDDAFNKLEDELWKEKEALMDQDVNGGEILNLGSDL